MKFPARSGSLQPPNTSKKNALTELFIENSFIRFAFLYFLKIFNPATRVIFMSFFLSKSFSSVVFSAKTFTRPCFYKALVSPPIRLCIPPISGGKFLVDMTNII